MTNEERKKTLEELDLLPEVFDQLVDAVAEIRTRLEPIVASSPELGAPHALHLLSDEVGKALASLRVAGMTSRSAVELVKAATEVMG